MKVLLVGATGNVGKLVLKELLSRDVTVRVLVRSPGNIPADLASNPKLEVVEGSLLHQTDEELVKLVTGCDTVISTLGHNSYYMGVPFIGFWAPPYDLVTRASGLICSAITALEPSSPIHFIQLNTIGVDNPAGTDVTPLPSRSSSERTVFWMLRNLTPPYADSLSAANYLHTLVGHDNSYIKWTVVRPDAFIDGEVNEYNVNESIPFSVFAVNDTTKANIAHFISDLVTSEETWTKWEGKMPVIIDAVQKRKPATPIN